MMSFGVPHWMLSAHITLKFQHSIKIRFIIAFREDMYNTINAVKNVKIYF